MGANLNSDEENSSISDINITPLVDVMLVLLIIFMITTPMMKQGIEVDLPQASPRSFEVETEERFVVSINKDGKMFLNEAVITLEQLGQKLTQIFESKAEKSILLESDARVPYGTVIAALDVIKSSGIVNIGMVTKEKTKEK